MTESFARSRFVDQILWEMTRNPIMDQWFVGRGYGRVTQGYHKQLDYHTAFVLGGGGAHGAYQIGRMASAEKTLESYLEWVSGDVSWCIEWCIGFNGRY